MVQSPPKLAFREATMDDLDTIVEMLQADSLGATRESISDLTPYREAMAKICAEPNNSVWIATDQGRTVGTFHLAFIHHLTFQGGLRAQIEGVRVHDDDRSRGIGAAMFAYAEQLARERGCYLLQLTSNRDRNDARRFYEKIGFKPTHVGFKKHLDHRRV